MPAAALAQRTLMETIPAPVGLGPVPAQTLSQKKVQDEMCDVDIASTSRTLSVYMIAIISRTFSSL